MDDKALEKDKAWLLLITKRLANYFVLKIGLLAIAACYAAADYVNAGKPLRLVYIAIFVLLVFYVYFYMSLRKYFKKLETILRKSQ